MSKYEYDSEQYVLDYHYKEQCIRQKNFLTENIDFNNISSIMEVGAASGYNLSLYKSDGRILTGIEPSERNCHLAKSNYQINIFPGMFKEYLQSEEKRKFDLIFLSMVLEHIVDPARFIHDCRQLCNKYIFIDVPTLDIRHAPEEPMGVFSDEHVNLFTLDGLNSLMSSEGFGLVNVENIYGINKYIPAGYPSIATIWEKDAADINASRYRYNLFSAEELLDKYLADSKSELKIVQNKIDKIPPDMNLAVWGIGNHASMLLANTSLKNKNIVRVYDSDIKKHFLNFAGVEISAFNKEDVENGIVNGILITTYTAQKSILKYIKSQNINCPVIVLYDI